MADLTTLYFTNPELRDEWDDNIEKMKQYIPPREKVKWKCKSGKICHRWIASIASRKKKDKPRGCPYCVGKQLCEMDDCWCNTLWALRPNLHIEWDGNVNDMKKYSVSSGKIVNWKCKEGINCHKWTASISNRTKLIKPRGCGFCADKGKRVCTMEDCSCNSLWAAKEELREYWDGDIEDMKKIFKNSNQIVNWKCKTGNVCHNFKSPANNYCCPYCRYREPIICKIDHCNSLWALFPELRDEWCGNIEEMKKYFPNSQEEKSWKCNKTKCKHIWNTTIINRTKFNINCLVCAECSSGKQICSTDYCNSLWALFPELRDEWYEDIEKMKTYLPFSNEPVKWKCKTGKDCHIYESPISRRTGVNKSGCSYCSGYLICSKDGCWCNSLWSLRPDLRIEWEGDIEEMKKYPIASHSYVKWKCINGHIWPTRINQRTINNCGCPFCNNKTEQKLYDALIQYYIELTTQFKVEWCKNKKCLPFDFVIEDYKIIIELDGPQHFEQVSNWQSPEETHLNDVYKMKCANENGYSVIRLLQTDVFYDTYDWLMELRENIEKIRLEQRVQNIYMCKDNEYAVFNPNN